MSDAQGASWPEQEAIEAWWRKARLALLKAATEERLLIQKERNALQVEVERLIEASARVKREGAERMQNRCADVPLTVGLGGRDPEVVAWEILERIKFLDPEEVLRDG